MFVDIYLTDTSTGISKVYHDNFDWEEPDHAIRQYIRGNYECDCNRSLFFYNWQKEPYPCNSESNVIILDKITDRNTGRILFP